MRRLRPLGIVLSWAMLSIQARGQSSRTPPPYTPMVWDEDWSYLEDAALASDWSDRWQHLSLPKDGYVSIGGQVRERGEYIDYPNFSNKPSHDGYLLQRYLLDTDWQTGKGFRLFLQFGSSFENNRDGGPRPGIDQDTVYWNQIFFDYSPNEHVTVRAGRQLIALGSTRLFAIGYGLNVQQPFDGARIMVRAAGWKLDLLAVRPTQILAGAFQNEPNSQVSTWGVYGTHAIAASRNLNIDLYYIGYDRKSWHWAAATGREQRESFGARIWHDGPRWSSDLEFTPQTGRFGSSNIRAWAGGYHLSRRFAKSLFAPVAEIDGGVTSGQHHLNGRTLGTFNALFPNGSYLSESLLIGPYNLVMVRPKLQMNVTRKLTLAPNLEFLWRQSTADGVYNIVGLLTHPGLPSRGRFVGSQIQSGLTYTFTRHFQTSVVFEHFFPGPFLKQTPPNRSVNLLAPTLTYTF